MECQIPEKDAANVAINFGSGKKLLQDSVLFRTFFNEVGAIATELLIGSRFRLLIFREA